MVIEMSNYPKLGQYDLTSLQGGIIGGLPVPIEILNRMKTNLHMATACVG
jgi:hypothetical protein